MSIMDLSEIVELKMRFTAKVRITLKWFDSRVFYHNLKPNIEQNLIPHKEKSKLWVPLLIFNNTDKNEKLVNDKEAIMLVDQK